MSYVTDDRLVVVETDPDDVEWPHALAQFATAVRATARALDDVRPDWFDAVDLRALNMRSLTDCVAGQVFGHHQDAFAPLAGHVPFEVARAAFSFYCPITPWLAEVRDRRATSVGRAS